MARTALQKVYADFRQGFVSVANPLAYPEGSLKDIVNFDILDNGTLSKRPGLRKENGEYSIDSGISAGQHTVDMKTAYWPYANNDTGRNYVVVFKNYRVYLFDANLDEIDWASPAHTLYDLITMAPLYNGVQKIQTVAANGSLYITHPAGPPKRIYFNGNGNIDVQDINIKIRDLTLWEGISDEDTGNVTRPQTLTPIHEYNLRNAGWPYNTTVSREENPDNDVFYNQDPVTYTEFRRGYYPPLNFPFFAARAGSGGGINEQNAYNPWYIDTNYFGSYVLPMGRKIVDAASFRREGDGASALTGTSLTEYIKEYSWTAFPNAISFYAGRVWYAGAKGYQEREIGSNSGYKEDNLDVSGNIYFSQYVGQEPNRASKCYQENDPTQEDINQLLATDGGVISIKNLGEVYRLVPYKTAMLVFSSEGIWSISGKDVNSFQADNYSINKISNVNVLSTDNIVESKYGIYFLTQDGIYFVTQDEVTGLPVPQNISSQRIKDFYQAIPYDKKVNSKSFYDEGSRLFYMLYEDADQPNEAYRNYRNLLIFNQDLGAFYKYRLPDFDQSKTTSLRVVDAIFYPRDLIVDASVPITLDGTAVTLDGEPVVLENVYSTAALSTIILVMYDAEDPETSSTNNKLYSASFTDINNFEDIDVPFSAYAETGFDSAGDIMRDSIKAPVLISHMERTEDGFEETPSGDLVLSNSSSCMLSYGWDWATNYKNGQQIYRFNRNYVPSGSADPFNYGVEVITTRNRIRGKGHSLGLRIDSEAGKNCKLLGIGILYTAAQEI